MLNVVIAKPTKNCNAGCSYCGAALSAQGRWSFEDFKLYFDKLEPYLAPDALWLWHGGEPLLMGPAFYEKTYDYMKTKHPGLQFAIQTNILDYSTSKWKDTLMKMTGGLVSTSFDPDMKGRLYKGSPVAYTELFLDKLLNMRADGFQLFIIGTYDDEMYEKKLHLRMMEFCLAMGKGAPSLRFNYRYPAGRALGQGVMLSPENFASLLIETYDLWREAQPDFRIFPQVQMMQLLQSNDTRVNQCPWTRQCTGKFFGLEADGSIFNCCTFSDTNDDDYRFGNLRTHTVPELLNSLAARRLKRRRVIIDKECLACEFHHLCHGGCARDTILYGKGLYEKTFYCESWKKVFKYIKDSMEADAVRTDNLPEAGAFSQKEVETWSAYI